MEKVGSLLLVLLVLQTSLSVQAAPQPEPEPTYHGKTLNEWITSLEDPNFKIRMKAAGALGLGPFNKAAVPALRKALKDRDLHVREAAVIALGDIGPDAANAADEIYALWKEEGEIATQAFWTMKKLGPAIVPLMIEALKSEDKDIRRDAISILGDNGADSKDAIPLLIEIAKNSKNQNSREIDYAVEALGKIGQPAVSHLLKLLDDADPDIRSKGFEALSYLRPPSKEASLALLKRLHDSDLDVCQAAISALARQDPCDKDVVAGVLNAVRTKRIELGVASLIPDSSAIELLKASCQDENPDVQALSLRILSHNYQDVGPFLVKALRKDQGPARFVALDILPYNPCAPSIVLPALKEAIANPNEEVRRTAVSALRGVYPCDRDTVQLACRALEDENPEVRKAAFFFVIDPGSHFLLLVKALAKALQDENAKIRREAAGALKSLGPKAESAVSDLTKALKDSDTRVQFAALKALGSMGSKAKDAVEAIEEKLQSDDSEVRAEAAITLWNVDPNNPQKIPNLLAIANDSTGTKSEIQIGPNGRKRVIRTLGEVKDKATLVVPTLTRILSEEFGKLGKETIDALATMGPAAKDAVPELTKLFKERLGKRDSTDKCRAALALAAIDPHSISLLAKGVDHPDPAFRKAVCDALFHMKEKPKEAVLLLGEFLYDQDNYIRRQAVEALIEAVPKALPALPALVEALRLRESVMREQSAKTIGAIGPDAKAAVPDLVVLLKDSNAKVRLGAFEALGKIGHHQLRHCRSSKRPWTMTTA